MKIMILLFLVNISFLSANDIEIHFVDEKGKAIKNGKFFLFEDRDGEFHKALYRGHLLKDGSIKLRIVPKEGSIGYVGPEGYYDEFIDFKDSSKILKPGLNKIKIKKTGKIRIKMSQQKIPIEDPFVVPFYLHKGKEVELEGGIGVFLAPGSSFEIKGLLPGKYHFEIRKNYDKDSKVLFKSKEIKVDAGKTSQVADVNLGGR